MLKLPVGKRYVSFYCELASELPSPRSFFRKDQRTGGTSFLTVKIKLASGECRSLSIFAVSTLHTVAVKTKLRGGEPGSNEFLSYLNFDRTSRTITTF